MVKTDLLMEDEEIKEDKDEEFVLEPLDARYLPRVQFSSPVLYWLNIFTRRNKSQLYFNFIIFSNESKNDDPDEEISEEELKAKDREIQIVYASGAPKPCRYCDKKFRSLGKVDLVLNQNRIKNNSSSIGATRTMSHGRKAICV